MFELNVINILKAKNKSKYWLLNQLNSFNDTPMLSYTNFNNLINNKTKSIKYITIFKLCTILECSPNDLFINVNNTNK